MSNHIDLTLDDPQDSTTYPDAVRYAKRPRTDLSPWLSQESTPSPSSQASSSMSTSYMSPSINPVLPGTSTSRPQTSQPRFGFRPPPYRPLFAGSSFHSPDGQQSTPPTSSSSLLHYQQQMSTQPLPSPRPPEQDIIDLTSSPSPPPVGHPPGSMCEPQLPLELPPKTPVCIGQFSATALILYPDQYTMPQSSGDPEWVPVRLQYEKPAGRETIHIKTPSGRGINGESVTGDRFGMIEQKVADSIGPMLARGLIRLESKIRKGSGVSLSS
jgi:SWI/SNF-related matrix-associated actin-dependent regulator of chromatin subfamily A3